MGKIRAKGNLLSALALGRTLPQLTWLENTTTGYLDPLDIRTKEIQLGFARTDFIAKVSNRFRISSFRESLTN